MNSSKREICKTDTIGIVCHDAGGAEIISEWLLETDLPFQACLAGPAVHIFNRKFSAYNEANLDILLKQSDWVLCGTSWQSDLEKIAVKRSLELGLFVAVCLDHWINYEDRFLAEGVITLPSEIWVADSYALDLVTELFPDTPVRQIENPYLKKIRSELDTFQDSEITIDILYVCEPIKEHAKIKYGDENFLGYTEESALRFFIDNIKLLTSQSSNITIRPHPSDAPHKYDWVKDESTNSLAFRIGGNEPLVSEISSSRIVVGCQSMAMVVALIAERQVYSSIPNGGQDCVLPHRGIARIRDLIDINGMKNSF